MLVGSFLLKTIKDLFEYIFFCIFALKKEKSKDDG